MLSICANESLLYLNLCRECVVLISDAACIKFQFIVIKFCDVGVKVFYYCRFFVVFTPFNHLKCVCTGKFASGFPPLKLFTLLVGQGH